MGEADTLHVAVVGAGAFGRNHLRVYRALQNEGRPVRLVAAVDPDPQVRASVKAEYRMDAFASVEELLESGLPLAAASIATPTVQHTAAALALLAAGVDLLIEKPIAPSLADADRILAAALQHGRVVQVGHLERFNPAVTAALPLLNRPMFFEAHRLSVFTPRSLDVDVVLDLMIHDLDIVLTLAGSPVREVRAVGLPVLSRKVDIANVRVEFQSGAVANFTASRVSTERVRKLRFFQPHQYLSLDFARQDLLLIDVSAAGSLTPAQVEAVFASSAVPATAASAARIAAGAGAEAEAKGAESEGSRAGGAGAPSHPSPGLLLRKVPTRAGEPLRLEMEAFLQAVVTRKTPQVSAADGRRALHLALDIQEAIADHTQRSGLSSF